MIWWHCIRIESSWQNLILRLLFFFFFFFFSSNSCYTGPALCWSIWLLKSIYKLDIKGFSFVRSERRWQTFCALKQHCKQLFQANYQKIDPASVIFPPSHSKYSDAEDKISRSQSISAVWKSLEKVELFLQAQAMTITAVSVGTFCTIMLILEKRTLFHQSRKHWPY